jgi:hypothetical protein
MGLLLGIAIVGVGMAFWVAYEFGRATGDSSIALAIWYGALCFLASLLLFETPGALAAGFALSAAYLFRERYARRKLAREREQFKEGNAQ